MRRRAGRRTSHRIPGLLDVEIVTDDLPMYGEGDRKPRG